MKNRASVLVVFAAVLGISAAARQNQPVSDKKISKQNRELARSMLSNIANDIKKHYYDPRYHGLDWDGIVAGAENAIDRSVGLNHALSEIAASLDKLDDSHTFFLPPVRPYTHEFGWQLEMVGSRCFVMQVRPQSDADAKGIKRGDEVLALNGFQPTRESLPRMSYIFNILRPQPTLRVVVRSPQGQNRQLEVSAAMRERKRVLNLTMDGGSDIWDILRENERDKHFQRARWAEVSADVLALKFPSFTFSAVEVDNMMDKARNYKALILDLRGNPGGSVDTLKALVGSVLDHPVKIGDRVTRDGSKPMEVKSRGQKAFVGRLVVLVDSKSASAAELFARAMQLENRTIVLGDKTAGAVMEAKFYSYKSGLDTITLYGASITDADIIMNDGKSLEHSGVTPDEIILPTADDLTFGRDPVLVRAAALCGVAISPETAGGFFPYEWVPL